MNRSRNFSAQRRKITKFPTQMSLFPRELCFWSRFLRSIGILIFIQNPKSLTRSVSPMRTKRTDIRWRTCPLVGILNIFVVVSSYREYSYRRRTESLHWIEVWIDADKNFVDSASYKLQVFNYRPHNHSNEFQPKIAFFIIRGRHVVESRKTWMIFIEVTPNSFN